MWRDAGEGANRPDITLTLHRVSDTTPLESAHSDRLWFTKENNWFWRCDFGSVDKYDKQGSAYEYRVTEAIVQSGSKYSPSYYNGTVQPIDSDSTETTFDQSAGADQYARASYLINNTGNAGTIINTLSDTLVFHGKKLWLDLPAWFNIKNLPDIYIQLYRSTNGTDYEAFRDPILMEDGDSEFTIPANGDKLPLYNEYGKLYQYEVREVSKSGQPHTVNGYKAADIKDGVVTNTYVNTSDSTLAPLVKVNVTKKWDFANRIGDVLQNGQHPATTFALHRVWTKEGVAPHDELVDTKTLAQGDIPSTNMAEAAITFISSEAKPLLYYSPDGTPYRYYIEETAIEGYAVTPASHTIDVSFPSAATADVYEGNVILTNTYDPDQYASIAATKIWSDSSNRYGTRPAFSAMTGANPPIVFALYVRVKGSTGDGIEIDSAKLNAEWTEKEDNANQWICTFTPKPSDPAASFAGIHLNKYDTMGQALEYYVKETLDAAYDTNAYYPSALRIESGLTVTNKLSTVNLFLDKKWEDDAANTLEVDELKSLIALSGIAELTFGVQWSSDEGATWADMPDASTEAADDVYQKTFSASDLIDAYQKDKYLSIATSLPRYDQATGLEYQYRIKENDAISSDLLTVINPTLAASGSANKVSTVTNQFKSRKLYFVKDWDDDFNRDKARPSRLTINVTRTPSTGGTNQSFTAILTSATTSSDPNESMEGHGGLSDGTRWRGELTVPHDGTYTASEVTPNQYTMIASSAAPDLDWFSFDNQHIPHRITINATKVWGGDGRDADYGDRPNSVELRLEYKLTSESSSSWRAVPDNDTDFPASALLSQTLSPTGTQTWGDVEATWTDLPAYQKGRIGIPYSYRVVEVVNTNVSGYMIADSIEVKAKAVVDSGASAADVTVANTLKTTSLNVEKDWVDHQNALNHRPDEVILTLERRLRSTIGEGGWAVVSSNGRDVMLTLSKSSATPWQGAFTGLPTHNAEGAEYEYRAIEVTPPDYYINLEETSGSHAIGNRKTKVTNALRVISFYATKVWTDQSGTALSLAQLRILNELGGLPSVTFTVQRRTNASAEWEEIAARTITADEYIQTLANGDAATYLIAEKKLRYIEGTSELYEYQLIESVSDTTDVTLDASPVAVLDETDACYATSTTAFQNQIAVRKMFLVKNWDDEYNRDSSRPAVITFTITRNPNTVASKSISLTLDATCIDSSDPKKAEDEHKYLDDGTRWLGEQMVPSSGVYEVTETLSADYAQSQDSPVHEHADAAGTGNAYDWWSFTNRHNPKTITLTVDKRWTGGDRDADYGDRPDRVTVKLERKLTSDTTNAWVELTDQARTFEPDNGVWTTQWDDLPAYQEKAQPNDAAQAYSYRVVEEAHAGYTTTYGLGNSTTPLSVEASEAGTEKTLIINNALNTVRLEASKRWQDDATVTRPSEITIKLQRRLSGSAPTGVWTDVTTAGVSGEAQLVTATMTSPYTSVASFTELPKTDKLGSEYEYRAIEAAPDGRYRQTVTVTKNGDLFASTIDNDLQTVTAYANKSWTDDHGAALSLAMMQQLHAMGGVPDVTFTVERRIRGGEWSPVAGAALTVTGSEILQKMQSDDPAQRMAPYIVASGLPRYASGYTEGEQTEYEYRVREQSAVGVIPTYGATIFVPANVGEHESSCTTSIHNRLVMRKLYFVKNWDDFVNSDDARPANLAIIVTRDPDTPDNTSDDKQLMVTLNAGSTSTDPKALDPDQAAAHGTLSPNNGTRWFGEMIVPYSGSYSAVETVPTAQRYALSSTEHDDAPLPSGERYDWWSFTNTITRQTIAITVKKAWAQDGSALAWGDRPSGVTVKLQRKLADEPDTAWADLADTPASIDTPAGYQMQKTISPALNGRWEDASAGWMGLAVYQTKRASSDIRKAYCYRVVEVPAAGYGSSVVYNGDATLKDVNAESVTGTANAVVTNTLETVSLNVIIQWEDQDDMTALRPESVGVRLERRLVGSVSEDDWADVVTTDALTAPVDAIIRPDADGIWSDSRTFASLPKTDVNGQQYEYRVVQIDLPEHYSKSLSSTVSPDGSRTSETIINRLRRLLEIDNCTVNAATGETNAGGYVGIATSNPTQMDIQPYEMDQRALAWRPEAYWKHASAFTVAYRESASDEWYTVTASVNDLSALRARFSGATIRDHAGTRILTLADRIAQMPYQVRVLVTFLPTLAVENTAVSDRGGKVQIQAWSTTQDGVDERYHANKTRALAYQGWMVDTSHLQISIPGGVHDDYKHNSYATTLTPDSNGRFTAKIPVIIAQTEQLLDVSGRVKVLERDEYLNPTEVTITLSSLDVPLDVGMPFRIFRQPIDTPITGDPIIWVALAMLLSGISMLVITIVRRRRRRGAP